MEALRRIVLSDEEVRRALLPTPGRPGEASRLSIGANLVVAFTMLAILAVQMLLRPTPEADDLPLSDLVRSSLYYLHFVQPFALGGVAVLTVWNAATIYALRRERRVVRKLLDAIAPELDPARLAPMHWPRPRPR